MLNRYRPRRMGERARRREEFHPGRRVGSVVQRERTSRVPGLGRRGAPPGFVKPEAAQYTKGSRRH